MVVVPQVPLISIHILAAVAATHNNKATRYLPLDALISRFPDPNFGTVSSCHHNSKKNLCWHTIQKRDNQKDEYPVTSLTKNTRDDAADSSDSDNSDNTSISNNTLTTPFAVTAPSAMTTSLAVTTPYAMTTPFAVTTPSMMTTP
jgi:hypothetical protein